MSSPPSPAPAPPDYTTSHPQLLVAPLPDAASFFRGRAVQGEVFVKGLGDRRSSVQDLVVSLLLTNHLPEHPPVPLHEFPPVTLWSAAAGEPSSSAVPESTFPSVHRFEIPLPPGAALPGTLNLAQHGKGEIKWSLRVRLRAGAGAQAEVEEEVVLEGTPAEEDDGAGEQEAEEIVDRAGVRSRLLLADVSPRLGSHLHLGVELRPLERKKTGVAGLSSQPDPALTLRGLRRVRVELYRIVRTPISEHLSLLHASGKSLRYPGRTHPPLRLLFTLPTQLPAPDGTWGETTIDTPYHSVSFFVRVILGFGALGEAAPPELQDWVLERAIRIRPRGFLDADDELDGMSDDEAREAYRRKGTDVVGATGTWRSESDGNGDGGADGSGQAGPSTIDALPTFSEAQAAPRTPPVPTLSSELATWVEYDGYETFSVAPPSVSASYGASGSMDPPQPDDDLGGVAGAGDMAARLGLERMGGMELMERLGLGEGTRVVDLQDDLPPGIDEPSLPALPSFNSSQMSVSANRYPAAPHGDPPAPPPPAAGGGAGPCSAPGAGAGVGVGAAGTELGHDVSPPSFAASEAAQAHAVRGGRSLSVGPSAPHPHIPHVVRNAPGRGEVQPGPEQGAREDPPGYFGAQTGPPGGGPPAYS